MLGSFLLVPLGETFQWSPISVYLDTDRWYRLHNPTKDHSLARFRECCSWLKLLTHASLMVSTSGIMTSPRKFILAVENNHFSSRRKPLLYIARTGPCQRPSEERRMIWGICSHHPNIWVTSANWIHSVGCPAYAEKWLMHQWDQTSCFKTEMHQWQMNLVLSQSFQKIGTCQYSELAFNAESQVASPEEITQSSVTGVGHVSRIVLVVIALSRRKSMQIRQGLSGFGTSTMGSLHLLWGGSMTTCCSLAFAFF